MNVIAFVPDLMDRSRFSNLDATVTFVRAPAELATATGEFDVAVADLGRPGALENLAAANVGRKLGFVSHESREVFDQAAAAGVEALPRSRFLPRIQQVVTKN